MTEAHHKSELQAELEDCKGFILPGQSAELSDPPYSHSGFADKLCVLQQILEDVSEEHARKTITVDPFPHSGVPAASIHPCKHASVMKKLGNMAEANGKPLQVDRYGGPSHHDQQVMVCPSMLCFVPI